MPSDEEVTQRAGSVRSLTGLTEAACHGLLPHFEQACVPYMQDRTMDGPPRTRCRYTTSGPCPWPTIADNLLFMLTYLKQHPIQEVQGQLLGMRQSHANTWIPLRPPVLHQTVADHELLPARTAAEFAALFKPQATEGSAATPLGGMMALNGRSTAQPLLQSTKTMTVGRRRVTRSKTSSCATRPVTCAF